MKRAALISLLLCVVTPSMGVNNANNGLNMATPVARDQYQQYPTSSIQKPSLVEQFDKRYDDGHYEYSYTLSNGDKRYEHAYWQPVGNSAVLARKGYYSYPLPNNKYLTVFYTSDQNGFQQELSTYTSAQPNLPRTLDVPQQVHIKPLPAYGVAGAVHHSQVAVPHVSSTTAAYPAGFGASYVPTTPAPIYIVASPQEVGSYVSNVASTQKPSYILTSGAHHPWESQASYQQSNRVRRHAVDPKKDVVSHDTTTHSSKKAESTTSHPNQSKHESHKNHAKCSTTRIPLPVTPATPKFEKLQVAPESSSYSHGSSVNAAHSAVPSQHQSTSHRSTVSGADSALPYHHQPITHGSSVGVGHSGVPSQHVSHGLSVGIDNLGMASQQQQVINRLSSDIGHSGVPSQHGLPVDVGHLDIQPHGQPVGSQTFTGQGIHGSPSNQPGAENQNYQNLLLTYLASKVSAESPESYSSESRELYIPGLSGLGTTGIARRRLGNKPIWRNQPATNPYTTFGF